MPLTNENGSCRSFHSSAWIQIRLLIQRLICFVIGNTYPPPPFNVFLLYMYTCKLYNLLWSVYLSWFLCYMTQKWISTPNSPSNVRIRTCSYTPPLTVLNSHVKLSGFTFQFNQLIITTTPIHKLTWPITPTSYSHGKPTIPQVCRPSFRLLWFSIILHCGWISEQI